MNQDLLVQKNYEPIAFSLDCFVDKTMFRTKFNNNKVTYTSFLPFVVVVVVIR